MKVILHENYIYRETYEFDVCCLPEGWRDMTVDQQLDWLALYGTDSTLIDKYPVHPAPNRDITIEIDEEA